MSDTKPKIILAQIETQEVPQTEFSQFEIVNAVEASPSPGGMKEKKLIYIGEGLCRVLKYFIFLPGPGGASSCK